jgi:G3E family GTPase
LPRHLSVKCDSSASALSFRSLLPLSPSALLLSVSPAMASAAETITPPALPVEPEEGIVEKDDDQIVEKIGDLLMEIYFPAKDLSDTSAPRKGNERFEEMKTSILEALGKVKNLLDDTADAPWYKHIPFSHLRDCVCSFLRQAGLLHTTTYSRAEEAPKEEDIISSLLLAYELLESLLQNIIQVTRETEIQIKYPEEKRIPVLVITGFLGSGKTTLLNHILSSDHGLRIAVIENEFGEIGVDESLVKRRFLESEEIFEMNNGCICCTVRGDLIRILKRLITIRDKYDHILIETTGLADPAPIAQTFFVDPQIGWTFRLDGIITVVDIAHIDLHLNEEKPEGVENESVEQIAFANIILLNKMDLVNYEIPSKEVLAHPNSRWWENAPDRVKDVVSRISSMNSDCVIYPCIQNKIPLDLILHQRKFDLSRILQSEPAFLEDENHLHDLSVKSLPFCLEGEMDVDLFESWLQQTLRTYGVVSVFKFCRYSPIFF